MITASGDFNLLLFIPFVLIGIASIFWHFNRSATLLDRWAARNGLRIVSREYRWLARGPFWWRTSKSQSVYRVEVIDSAGETRTGYVRLGSWPFGLWSDVAAVEWDQPATTHGPRGFPVVIDETNAPADRGQHD